MRLSTSTNIMHRVGEQAGAISIGECLRRCAQAGYRVMDINFVDQCREGRPLRANDWEAWVDRVGETAARYGLTFSQSHAWFYNVCDTTRPDRAEYEEWVRRSIVASGRLGVRWVVMHAGTVNRDYYSPVESKRRNLAYFAPFVELARKSGCGIAIENMADFGGFRRRYTASPEELVDLVDTIHDPAVGICWDFGHGNLCRLDQAASLRLIGSRLKATHVADNHGSEDEHLAPFMGTVPWPELMRTLHEIGYTGDFTYEIHKFTWNVPEPLRDAMLAYTVRLGEYLVGLSEKG